ncbi:hypothetical protein FQA39_LY07120 [Lamprigera yunnana]|nr:hypothetical protein FQA39_LY07120 [Lamprigera yunnana]
MEMHTDIPNTFTDDIMTLAGCHISTLAANKVFRKMFMNPTDVDVVDLHDCFSTHELVLYEILGLCAPGKGGELVDQNNNTYGGKYVVNLSGGLIGKGHPLGTTGIAQCGEPCWQLRSDAGERQVKSARLTLQHNYGLGGAAVVALYSQGFAMLPFYYSSIIDINRNNFKIGLILLIHNLTVNDQHNLFYKFIVSIQFKVERFSGCAYECIIKIAGNSLTVERYDNNEKPDIILRLTVDNLNKIMVNG